MAPLVGRIVDGVVPWYACLFATFACVAFHAIQTGAGGLTIAAVVIDCFGIDVFRQMQQVSLTTAVLGIEPSARSRLNSIVIIFVRIRTLPLATPSDSHGVPTGVHRPDHGHGSRHESIRNVRLASCCRALRRVDRLYPGRYACSRTALFAIHMVRIRRRLTPSQASPIRAS